MAALKVNVKVTELKPVNEFLETIQGLIDSKRNDEITEHLAFNAVICAYRKLNTQIEQEAQDKEEFTQCGFCESHNIDAGICEFDGKPVKSDSKCHNGQYSAVIY